MSVSTASKPTPKTAAQAQQTEQELTSIFRARQGELQALVNKIGELEREAEEHVLVIETLRDAFETEPTRKCFRLVGGVLVERTVADVLPELESQLQQIKSIMETLLKEYKKKEVDFGEWQRANNIVVKQR